MTRSLLLFGAAALLAVGCSTQSPLAAGEESPATPAAKLTVSGGRAGGHTPVESPPGTPVSGLTRQYELRFDQSLDADGLELAWLEVSDSRCPEGAVCVWEGEVGVLLGARRGDQDLGTVALTRRHPGDERAQMRIANRLIQLVEVTPYPVVDQEIGRAEYLAILAVTPVRERRPPDGGLVGSEAPAGGYSGEEPRPEPDGKPDYTSLKAALEKNRQLWEQQGFDAYQFRFQRSCFCLPEMRQPVELIVRDRQIQSARYADGGAAVDAGEFGRYQTVEGLFDLIEAAIAGEAARIEVEFDPQYGYPTRLYVDYYLTMADEERSYEAGGLQPLR